MQLLEVDMNSARKVEHKGTYHIFLEWKPRCAEKPGTKISKYFIDPQTIEEGEESGRHEEQRCTHPFPP